MALMLDDVAKGCPTVAKVKSDAMPRRRGLTLTVCTVAAVLTFTTACGTGGTAPSAGGQAGSGATAPGAATSSSGSSALKTDPDGFPVDQCSLVSKSLVESTLGITVAKTEPEKIGCEF